MRFPYRFPAEQNWRPPAPRVYPTVNPELFMSSARRIGPVLAEAGYLANKIAGSRDLSKRIMDAAQASHYDTVRQLMAAAGIRKDAHLVFNPDGITVEFFDQGCCKVSVSMRWR